MHHFTEVGGNLPKLSWKLPKLWVFGENKLVYVVFFVGGRRDKHEGETA